MTDNPPYALGRPGGRLLCPTCASRLFVILKYSDRWTICSSCDTGWARNAELDTVQRVGPPVVLRIEGRAL